MALFTTITTFEGERWDQVAMRAYGNAMLMGLIIDANPGVGIWDRLPGGGVLVVPVIDGVVASAPTVGMPPWMG